MLRSALNKKPNPMAARQAYESNFMRELRAMRQSAPLHIGLTTKRSPIRMTRPMAKPAPAATLRPQNFKPAAPQHDLSQMMKSMQSNGAKFEARSADGLNALFAPLDAAVDSMHEVAGAKKKAAMATPMPRRSNMGLGRVNANSTNRPTMMTPRHTHINPTPQSIPSWAMRQKKRKPQGPRFGI